MLTKHKVFDGKLVHAWTEPAYRETTRPDTRAKQYEGTNHRFVVDERDDIVGTVSDQYTLVRNADVIAALDLAAGERNLALDPTKAAYRNGRSFYEVKVPGFGYRVSGDPSGMVPSIIVRNDYRGGGGLKIQGGIFRLACTNGLVVGDIAYFTNQRHVGQIDVIGFFRDALSRMEEKIEVNRLLAEAMTRVRYRPEVVEAIIADTADRYRADWDRALRENVAEIGDNMWAVAQAVSELSTHRMQTRATGDARTEYNMGADTWATRQWDRIAALVGA